MDGGGCYYTRLDMDGLNMCIDGREDAGKIVKEGEKRRDSESNWVEKREAERNSRGKQKGFTLC